MECVIFGKIFCYEDILNYKLMDLKFSENWIDCRRKALPTKADGSFQNSACNLPLACKDCNGDFPITSF